MYKSIVLIAVFCFTLTSAITTQELGQCVEANCTSQITSCLSDSVCNASLPCFDACTFNDTTCDQACFTPVAQNIAFWALDLCSLTCMGILEVEEGDPIQQCEASCAPQEQDCLADSSCQAAAACVEGCGQENFDCAAECVVPYEGDQALMNLIHCQAVCLVSFLQQ